MRHLSSKNSLIRFASPLAAGVAALVRVGSTPALAQPPDPGTEIVAYSIPEVEAAWTRLRNQVGTREFTDTREAIARYQKFYEACGYSSAQTAITISSAIAQLYWQQLNDRAKALAIYDWAIAKYGSLPRGARLQQERDLVAATAAVSGLVAAPPVALQVADTKVATEKPLAPLAFAPPSSAPVIAPPPVVLSAPDAAKTADAKTPNAALTVVLPVAPPAPFSMSVPLKAAQPTTKPAPSAALAPVTLPTPTGAPMPPVAGVAAPSRTPSPNSPSLPAPIAPAPSPAPLSAPAPVAFSPVNARTDDGKPLAIAPPASATGAPFVAPPSMNMKTSAPRLQAPPQLNARIAMISGLVSQWREGKMTWSKLTQQAPITPAEAIELLASPAIITNYSDKDLRRNLLAIAMQSPDLLKDRAALAPPVQIALAESDRSQGEAIYRELLKGKIPEGVWWNRLIVMTLLADHYAAMGDFEKAALTKLEIGQIATDESWRANTTVEAARYLMQAGQTEKANALYKQAEKSSYGWAQGLALYRVLLSIKDSMQRRDGF
jgi:hypothetical protein